MLRTQVWDEDQRLSYASYARPTAGENTPLTTLLEMPKTPPRNRSLKGKELARLFLLLIFLGILLVVLLLVILLLVVLLVTLLALGLLAAFAEGL